MNDLSSSGSAIKVLVLKSGELPFSDHRMPYSALRVPARKPSPYGPPPVFDQNHEPKQTSFLSNMPTLG